MNYCCGSRLSEYRRENIYYERQMFVWYNDVYKKMRKGEKMKISEFFEYNNQQVLEENENILE